MDAQTPFFGAKISLVSKSEIRYEGMLYTIDPKESTIALAKVRSFGTEDRPAERQVPPRDEIFEFIIFRASDIKDLVVDEAPNGGGLLPQQQQPAPFVDPAIVKSGQQPLSGLPNLSSGPSTSSQPQSSNQAKSNDTNGQIPQVDSTKKSQTSQAPKPAWGGINQLNLAQQSQSQQNRNQSQQNRHNNQVRPPFDPQNRGNNFNNQQGGRGGFRLQGHPGQGFRGPSNFNQRGFNNQRGGFNRGMSRGMGRGGFGQRNGSYQIKFAPLPDGEFDFEKAHSDFQMLEEKLKSLKMNGDSADDQELPPIEGIPASAITVSALEEEEIPKEPCYNKGKSFFDTISCEAIEREKGNVKRVDWKAERSQNKETFGVSSTRPNQRYFHNNNRRGGYGFNNRGGGYGRGRGGGGFRRYNNNNQNRQSSGNEEPTNDASPSVEATA